MLATDCQRDELEHYLGRLTGVADLVDAVACGDDVRHGKPEPKLVETALSRLHAGDEPAVLVGDTPSDAKAARRCGIGCVGVLTGHFSESDLRAAGCAVVFPGLVELAHQIP